MDPLVALSEKEARQVTDDDLLARYIAELTNDPLKARAMLRFHIRSGKILRPTLRELIGRWSPEIAAGTVPASRRSQTPPELIATLVQRTERRRRQSRRHAEKCDAGIRYTVKAR